MELEERLNYLRAIDLFDAFPDKEQRLFAQELVEVRLTAGDYLFLEGDTCVDIYILLKGELRVFKNNRLITTVLPVEYIGEMALIEDKPRSATVEAATACQLFQLDSALIRKYLKDQSPALISMMKGLSRKIRNDTALLASEFEKTNILIHDMKNLLTAFLHLDLLERQMTTDKQRRAVRTMITCRHNLQEMMNEALVHVRQRQPSYSQAPGSLSELVEELAEAELSHLPELADKPLSITCADPLPDVVFNRRDLRRVLLNLILNAAQASYPGGRIEIRLRHGNDHAEIRVKDHGHGILPQHLDKIFHPHFSTRRNGCGLGLASCKRIVEESHGGTLRCASEPEQGTEFIITLPLP